MKDPGILIQLPDGRKVRMPNKQPLLKPAGKLMFFLIDDNYNYMYDEDKKIRKTIFKTPEEYENLRTTWRLIGYVD